MGITLNPHSISDLSIRVLYDRNLLSNQAMTVAQPQEPE